MNKAILRIVGILVVLSPAIGFAQNKKPTAAYYITKEQVDTVNKTPGVDRTIQVMDIGDQHFSVGIIHRGRIPGDKAEVVELVGLYWHFVDVVWVIIFTLVYLIPA